MTIFLCLPWGALIGWLGSLIMRTQTSAGILFDMLVGAVAALDLAWLLAGSSTFDNLVAGYLGAIGALAVLYGVRRRRKAGASSTAMKP